MRTMHRKARVGHRADPLAAACRPFIAAFIAFAIAQLLKVFTFWYSERRWDYTRVVGSGGMPSSHTACVRPSEWRK
jgi:acid phosphatase family membrane protein YuiD